ncbi:MAG: hypothetical protein LQ349_005477 [Xanthoria aureola]|nr:MAG: hypothetical protein LQ349_005477 [Xanthoria aureola]
MRLLHVSTFRLSSFIDEECPPYAILSHTWGDQEITLQELQSEDMILLLQSVKTLNSDRAFFFTNQKHGPGCKIAGCALQAEKDGFEYIWCDTCCIDKTNSTELSEAINSMYLWYRDQLCYAYLADVPSADREAPGQRTSDLVESRWFTRGWTLQELIAPASVVFFNARWHPIGTRSDNRDLIATRTGIDTTLARSRTTIYVAQNDNAQKARSQWTFSFGVPHLPPDSSEQGVILKLVPNDEMPHVSWNPKERQVNYSELAEGLGAVLYLGRKDGSGKMLLIGLDSKLHTRYIFRGGANIVNTVWREDLGVQLESFVARQYSDQWHAILPRREDSVGRDNARSRVLGTGGTGQT